MKASSSRSTAASSRRMGPAAMIGGLLLAATVAAPGLVTPTPTQATPTLANGALVPVSAPSGIASTSTPVREIVAMNKREEDNDHGVKGRFRNLSATPITIGDCDKHRFKPFTLGPNEYFTFVINNKVDFWTTYGHIVLSDVKSCQPESMINHGSHSHKVGDVNRMDGDGLPGFDVSVKREENGTQHITGECAKTGPWANMNVFVDDYNAAVTSLAGTVSNCSKDAVVVRALKDGDPVSGYVLLLPGQRHEFALAASGNTVQVFNPDVSSTKPVGELAYSCPNRLSWGKVTSTYVDSTSLTPKTLVSDKELGVHGGSAHLDAAETGTYADRPRESPDPNLRTNSKSSVTIKIYKIGKHTLPN